MLNFQKQVLEASHEKPVLVDFWAAWCGPCRMLTPVLERLSEEQKDRWELVKINTEEEEELAREYGIRSIPNVKLFHNGEIIGEFTGAKPRGQVMEFLDKYIPSAAAKELQAIVAQQDENVKEEQLRNFLASNPENTNAKLTLAKLVVFSHPQEAIELTSEIQMEDAEHDTTVDLQALAELMQSTLENVSVTGKHMNAAKHALLQKDEETAIQKIIEATMADKHYANDLPRRTAIALFRLWGREHPLTQAYRRRFDMVLY